MEQQLKDLTLILAHTAVDEALDEILKHGLNDFSGYGYTVRATLLNIATTDWCKSELIDIVSSDFVRAHFVDDEELDGEQLCARVTCLANGMVDAYLASKERLRTTPLN